MSIEQLWEAYHVALRRFLISRVRNPADAEDLLHEVFLKISGKLHTVRSQRSVRAWMFQIAHHAIVDFYRERAKTASVDEADLWFEPGDDDVQRELARCIEPFIRLLPNDDAALLMAIEIEGQSQKAYAQRHGIAYSTLKSRVQTARKRLRGVFEACCQLSLDANGHVVSFEPKSGKCRC